MRTKPGSRPGKSDIWEARRSVTYLAARLLADGDEVSLRAARRKAAERLRVSSQALPTLSEIQNGLREHQRLFHPEQDELLKELRQQSLKAMEAFAAFRPRLTGPVLHGTATSLTPITLHLFCDAAEEVGLVLLERDIPHELTERRVTYPGGRGDWRPCYEFSAGETDIELVVFAEKDIKHGPSSPVDGKPMRRAAYKAVETLLSESAQPSFQ
jgi:hypothetical protein